MGQGRIGLQPAVVGGDPPDAGRRVVEQARKRASSRCSWSRASISAVMLRVVPQ
jgi:hypothetical protein